jgi:hypothetical protein
LSISHLHRQFSIAAQGLSGSELSASRTNKASRCRRYGRGRGRAPGTGRPLALPCVAQRVWPIPTRPRKGLLRKLRVKIAQLAGRDTSTSSFNGGCLGRIVAATLPIAITLPLLDALQPAQNTYYPAHGCSPQARGVTSLGLPIALCARRTDSAPAAFRCCDPAVHRGVGNRDEPCWVRPCCGVRQ